jgi:hypothetical protein
VKSAISSIDLRSRSGGIEGRPTNEYIPSNTGDNSPSASSASFFSARRGCPAGTRDSGDINISIDDCFGLCPRMGHEDKFDPTVVDPRR